MTGIRSFLRKGHNSIVNTVIPLTGYGNAQSWLLIASQHLTKTSISFPGLTITFYLEDLTEKSHNEPN